MNHPSTGVAIETRTFKYRWEAERECGGVAALENQAELDARDEEARRERMCQWPGAWADEMLRRRAR